ncbi:glycosyltransferase family 2 protein [Orenia marismortui]|uniref:Glycosyl transferase family 2 n=1 Tax=Orenia marismortui TaxID=46469 RepID=A0A4R8HFN7_9FIRM|nr:glycosyltransferase family 2 protein [Orenia marismortui]TDX58925.1 glycosyl transferase family 2 [Orenia marismortui]
MQCLSAKDTLNITAIVPTYNSEDFIEETIYSILNQSKALDEIIIIDDNSKDNTIKILDEIKETNDNIKIHRLEKNYGSSQARNIGIKLAKNDWIMLMDHDDIAEPELLDKECQRLIELNKQNKEDFILVHSAYQQMDEKGNKLPGIHSWKQVEPYEILGYEFVRNRIISNSGVLLNKQVALEVGGYDSELKYSQDWDLWIKLCQRGAFAYVDEPLVRLRRHEKNTSRKVEDFLKDEKRILNKYSINFIEEAINKRDLDDEVNKIDFVSVLFRINRLDKAFEIIQEVIDIAPKLSSGHFFLGLYFIKIRELNKSSESFTESIRLTPKNAAAINNLGCIMLLRNKKEYAEELFNKALDILNNYMDAKYNLDILLEKRDVSIEDLKFTWRELRSVLLNYSD